MRIVLKILILLAVILIPANIFTHLPKSINWPEQLSLPDKYNPWSDVDLTKPAGLFTGYKFSKFSDNLQLCTNALERAEIEFQTLPDQTIAGCSLEDRVLLSQTNYPYSASIQPTCSVAAALVMWENTVVKPAAEKHLGSEITRINQSGVFNCRNIAGSTRRSQHAFANAVDISGFVTKDGQTISLIRDWGKDNSKGRFLKEIRDGSCNIFRGVLGPGYNAAHADHFHFDMGRFNICR